jgi:hypothetical protein
METHYGIAQRRCLEFCRRFSYVHVFVRQKINWNQDATGGVAKLVPGCTSLARRASEGQFRCLTIPEAKRRKGNRGAKGSGGRNRFVEAGLKSKKLQLVKCR